METVRMHLTVSICMPVRMCMPVCMYMTDCMQVPVMYKCVSRVYHVYVYVPAFMSIVYAVCMPCECRVYV